MDPFSSLENVIHFQEAPDTCGGEVLTNTGDDATSNEYIFNRVLREPLMGLTIMILH